MPHVSAQIRDPKAVNQQAISSYQRYCAWAENTAEEHQTEPAVIEWSFFTLGQLSAMSYGSDPRRTT